MTTPAEQNSLSNLTHFTVAAQAEPSVLPRILGFFAQDNYVPNRLRSRIFTDGDLVIDLDVPGLSDQRAAVIAEKLRQLVMVRTVLMEHSAAPASARQQA